MAKYSWFYLLLVSVLTSLSAHALNLQPFNARYHVYRGDVHVANTKLSLKKQNSEWVWFMSTKPRGIYSWLTRKKPFAETRLQETANDIQLLIEQTGEYPDQPAKQNTWFDHTHKTIYYMKGEQVSQQNLPDNVYNYHSIHLLYPTMLEQNQSVTEINFYQKGKLQKSSLTLEKQVELPGKAPKKVVDKVTHTFAGSKNKMVYYYYGETLAPLKIEQIKPGKDKSVMWRVDAS